ncbi:MAG: anthranilate synthase [Acidimicrobiales bacterium]|nr:MAG: anthranilate synthase [Acidimicrobiales bacterium]
MRRSADSESFAIFPGIVATDLLDTTDDPSALDSEGFWAVVKTFEGDALFARFAMVKTREAVPSADYVTSRVCHPLYEWRSSLSREGFEAGVRSIRDAIARGDVYQVNLTRVLSRIRDPSGVPPAPSLLWETALRIAREHPAPHAATVVVPSKGIRVLSASPESFLSREGRTVRSSPIKGTASSEEGLTDKDRAENVMIVDLVRNDLGRVCEWGSVRVESLCRVERHPGLVHLVSTVAGLLRRDVGWGDLLDATFPPGSVTGAPKIAALEMIRELEPTPRGVYCGSVGWVDADRRRAELNVAIRTFWFEEGEVFFGTGGGITWYSDPASEWEETELKARRLLELMTPEPVAGRT